MRKCVSLLLAALLLVGLLALPAAAATSTKVTPVVKKQELSFTGTDADAFRVAINLSLGSNAPGISAYIVTVSWDPNAVTLLSGNGASNYCHFKDNFNEGWDMIPDGTTLVNANNLQNGSLTVTSTGVYNRSKSNGTLFLLNFKPTGKVQDFQIKVTLGSSTVDAQHALASTSGNISDVVAESSVSLHVPLKLGDLSGNGKIDAADYFLLKRYCLRTGTLTEAQKAVADVTRDGKINSSDYFMLKRAVLQKKTSI